jgi:hypothetical protein
LAVPRLIGRPNRVPEQSRPSSYRFRQVVDPGNRAARSEAGRASCHGRA